MNAEQLKKNKRSIISSIKKHIISILDGNTISRTELVNAVISRLGFTKAELRDTCADGACVLARSYVGSVINGAIEYGEIIDNDGLLTLQLKHKLYDRRVIEESVFELLKTNVAMTKRAIFDFCISRLGADKTFSPKDDDSIRAVAGEILARLERRGAITVTNDKYCLKQETEEKIDAQASFIDSINSQGGEYFERYGAMLLRKYYEKCGFKVTECAVTGGSDDGGIDIIVRTEDKLGFKELIAVQAKARRNIHVSVKEVRAFIGAMVAQGASRGIYLTTSYFHEEARKLIDQIPNLTKIDGKILYQIAQECKLFKV
ncbi:MAG: restriction endonuclease [Clostridia bacterium]|nr:restriction endonuclease [Clostridia bacterium]